MIGMWAIALGYVVSRTEDNLEKTEFLSETKPSMSGKQILNFANPEQNTNVQRNKHKHIRKEREHLQN